eukprot:Gb_32389 [translate_table: standard]
MVFNTLYELEPLGINHFKGSILPTSVFYEKRINIMKCMIQASQRISAMSSVYSGCIFRVHIMFSIYILAIKSLSKIHAFAMGLEDSEKSFIWAIRRRAVYKRKNNDLIPEGFE